MTNEIPNKKLLEGIYIYIYIYILHQEKYEVRSITTNHYLLWHTLK